jgi:hypothetical protein
MAKRGKGVVLIRLERNILKSQLLAHRSRELPKFMRHNVIVKTVRKEERRLLVREFGWDVILNAVAQ